jgi:uncharacterized membrane protein YhaH (DUF805 family)
MKWRTYGLLVIGFSICGVIGSIVGISFAGENDVTIWAVLIGIFTLYMGVSFGLMPWRRDDKKQSNIDADVFGPNPADAAIESRKNWNMLILTTLIIGLIAIPIFYLIHPIACLAALLLFLVGFFLLCSLARKRKAELNERFGFRLEMNEPGTAAEYFSYRFDDESLSRVAEVISASRVSELPFSMPYHEKLLRLSKDGSLVILPSCSGTDRILSGIQSIMERRDLHPPEITKEAVIAEDSELFQNRRRDGFIADVHDLNVLARKLESAGFILLDLMYHPYRGHVITVVTSSEMEQLRTLTFVDSKDILRHR